MDNAVLMEIENLRRASLAGLRDRFREVFQEEPRSRHREHLFRPIAARTGSLRTPRSHSVPALNGLFQTSQQNLSELPRNTSLPHSPSFVLIGNG